MQDPEKYMAKIIRLAEKDETIPVHGDPKTGETGSRYYLHARNHADAILFILQKTTPNLYGENVLMPDRYNVVGDIELNNLQVVERIAKVLGKKPKVEIVDFHSTRPGHDKRYALDGSKLKALGWKPPVDFDASLKRYIEWTLKHPQWL